MKPSLLVGVFTLLLTYAAGASAATISGTVTNGTTHAPAAGDTVTLLALDQRMQEITKTTTDAHGHFSIDSPDAGMHLLRIDHQGAAYFQPAPPNTPNVNAQVFDVAAVVPGVSTVANVMRVETDGQGLRVTQSFFVKNDSNPPRTQFSKKSYEFYLPQDAQIEGSAAEAPGGMPVQSSPVRLEEKGHFAFLFPLRPGVTQFQMSYHLPYSGSLAFDQRFGNPTDSFVVMMPKSMNFKAAAGATFQSLNETPNALTFLTRNAGPAHAIGFTVSGSGAMPRDTQAETQGNDNGAGDTGSNAAANDTRPGGGLGAPIDTPDPLNKYKWWILGGVALFFAVGAGFLMRSPAEAAAPAEGPAAVPANTPGGLLAALKDELFTLETDHLQGRLTDTEYEQQKQALELVLRRALARKPA
ncbi:MAG: carboxypeptidase regulatory-like domain-containing protein [Acidobacteriaceae bacterium]